jgi:hypothetical protein
MGRKVSNALARGMVNRVGNRAYGPHAGHLAHALRADFAEGQIGRIEQFDLQRPHISIHCTMNSLRVRPSGSIGESIGIGDFVTGRLRILGILESGGYNTFPLSARRAQPMRASRKGVTCARQDKS